MVWGLLSYDLEIPGLGHGLGVIVLGFRDSRSGPWFGGYCFPRETGGHIAQGPQFKISFYAEREIPPPRLRGVGFLICISSNFATPAHRCWRRCILLLDTHFGNAPFWSNLKALLYNEICISCVFIQQIGWCR